MDLQGYNAWVECITVDCKTELTVPFIETRIKALRNGKDKQTRRYVQLYGEAHLEEVIGYFEHALKEKTEAQG